MNLSLAALRPGSLGYPGWLAEAGAPLLVGNPALLAAPVLAVVGSRRCPAALFFAATAWAVAEPEPVAGGFQTPVEAEVLLARLHARRPVVVCPARSVEGMRVPPAHRTAFEAGRVLYASATAQRRATAALGEARNRFVLGLARVLVVVHAAPGSRTLALAKEAARRSRPLLTFGHAENAPLVALGAALLPGTRPDGNA